MKRILSVMILLSIVVSLTAYSFAEDNTSVTQNIININEDLLQTDVVVPYFEGFKNADEINRRISNIVADSIGDARASAKSLEEYNNQLINDGEKPFEGFVELKINYDYVKNGDILSVNLNTYSYSGGAHGHSWLNTFTINTSTGEIYTIKSLFKNEVEGIKMINSLILDEIEKNKVMYFEDYEETIAAKGGNYDFYINGDKLVVYFGIYELSPYAAGIRYIIMDTDQMKNLLKDEVYDSINDGKMRGIISYNGTDINSNSKILKQDYNYLLPLREVAETLGYKVDWNKDNGAIIAGGFIKQGVNSYWAEGKDLVSFVPPIVKDGITYVPLQYFTEVLEENVSLGGMGYEEPIVRIFSKENDENIYYKLISDIQMPITNIEAANMYAEAVKVRNGAVQYGLLSDKLREEKYEDYKNWDFVTGASSPWIDSYEIIEIAENKYQIIYHYVTSVPTDSHTSTISIEVIEDGQYWSIDSINSMKN